ncbi:MAG: helix-turn-helix domain-containing protein [Chloroflexi bacterium]|nr:helix-turn-helix domain-containing protein [Chloroflexota bacterium]
MICRPVSPKCPSCPLKDICNFYRGEGNDLGAKTESNLRSQRHSAGMSLVSLSRLSGISKTTLMNAESGKTMPKSRTLRKISCALGVDITEITTYLP